MSEDQVMKDVNEKTPNEELKEEETGGTTGEDAEKSKNLADAKDKIAKARALAKAKVASKLAAAKVTETAKNEDKISEKKRFEVKKWNAVALWSWDIVIDTCAICRNHMYGYLV